MVALLRKGHLMERSLKPPFSFRLSASGFRHSAFCILHSAFCIAALAAFTVNAADLVLVDNGVPKATIVADTNAAPSYALAAKELQLFVKRMSGAELPIAVPGDAVKGPRILIGMNPATEAMNLGLAQKSSIEKILEEYVVRRVGDDLVLAGNDTLEELRKGKKGEKLDGWYTGSLFAVYDFLFEQGCRWYFPGEFGTVVPKKATIAVGDVDRRVKPAFLKHGFWWKGGYKDSWTDIAKWFARNRYIPYSAIYDNPTDGSIMGPFYRAGITAENHPEWFALAGDGTRQKNMICMSHPGVVAFLAENAKKAFRADPSLKSYGYAPPDGLPLCRCENCARANGDLKVVSMWDGSLIPCISGSYYKLMDEVAKAVRDEFPDRFICVSIYAGRIMPPPTYWKMQPNVVGNCAFIEYSLMRPIDDPDNWESAQIRSMLKSWKSRLDHVSYRPYYPHFLVNMALPLPFYRNNARDVKWLHANKVEGFIGEGWPSWGTDLLGAYLRSRLIWQPDADAEAIIDEFYSTFYGPAAKPAKAFYDALEKALVAAPVNGHESEFLHEIFTPAFVASLAPFVDEAEAIAAKAGDDTLAGRVRMVRLQYEQLRALGAMREAADRDYDFARAADCAHRAIAAENEMLGRCNAWIFPVHREYDAGRLAWNPLNGNFTFFGKATMYRHIAKLTEGPLGRMITPLPAKWKLRADTIQEGTAAQWYVPETDISGWDDIEIAHPLEFQGVAGDRKRCMSFSGDAWYAVDFDVEGEFDADKVSLFVGGINNEAWVWLNGVAIGHQPGHAWWDRSEYTWIRDVPKGLLKHGRNRMAVRCRCVDAFGFGGIFRGMFLFENPDHGTVKARKAPRLATTGQSALQMLVHGCNFLKADGNDLTFLPNWTRGLGVFTLDMKDPAKPSFKSGVMLPGYATGPRARSKDGKYLYYTSLYSLTVLEYGKGGWKPLRTITLNFSPADGPARGAYVDGDRLLVKGSRTARLFDISEPDAPVLVKADYVPAEGEFTPAPTAVAPETIAAQCPQKPKGGADIASYAETPERKYALVRNGDNDLYVFDKDGNKLASIPVVTSDGRMAVTTNALYFASGRRLCWFPLDAIGKGLSPSYIDLPMPKMHGRIYNVLTAGLVADGDKLYFDNAVIDISDPLAPKFVSPDGAPTTELQTGKRFLKTVEAGPVTCAIDTGHLYLLDTATGATNAIFDVTSPHTLDVIGEYAYVPADDSERRILACNLATGEAKWILGALKYGIGASTVADGLLYLSDGTVVRAFDMSNPTAPLEVATYAGGGIGYPPESPCEATGLAVVDGRLYVKFYSRILVFNVAKRH